VYVRQGPLLRGAHHLVAPPGHQTVHHIHRVIAGPLQHKPGIGTFQTCSLRTFFSRKRTFLVYDFPSHLPSELSSRHGGSLPLYFCSNTCLSPVSKPLNLERKEIRLKCYSNIPEAVLNPKLLQIGSSISARTEDKSWDQNVHWIQENILQWIHWRKALVCLVLRRGNKLWLLSRLHLREL